MRRLLRMALGLVPLLLAPDARARPFTLCALGFNGPEEVDAFRIHLRPPAFEIVDLAPRPVASASPGWLARTCRPTLRCDVVVFSGEFGGRFFGRAGFSLGLQELEEAACNPACDGLFRAPREVFLLACNTLATKDQDTRTPRQYLEVLLDHGFEQAAAERVVEMRYGPIGPSFREALRRAFAGVPRLYGFSSVAPLGVHSAPLLARYFEAVGDYARHLERLDGGPNEALRAALSRTTFDQTTGLRPEEPGAGDRGLVCALYDEDRSVAARLGIARGLLGRPDFLAFLPTMEAFLERHPPAAFGAEERALFAAMTASPAARREVLRLAHELQVSALKLEIAHFALQMGWLAPDEFRALAVDGVRRLLDRPFTSENADIVCEITRHQPVGDAIGADDFAGFYFRLAEGIRLVDCTGSTDPRVSERLADGLDSPDPATRLWAAYALSRRTPLPDAILTRLTRRRDDTSPEMRERVRAILRAHGVRPETP